MVEGNGWKWLSGMMQILLSGLLLAILVSATAAAIQSWMNAGKNATQDERLNRHEAQIESMRQRLNRLERQ